MDVRRPITRRAAATVALAALALAALAGPWTIVAVAAGPPFPNPENDRAVYDTADVFEPATRSRVEETIDAIEQRTGAEVVVYTQTVPCCESTSEAEHNAQALMDQW